MYQLVEGRRRARLRSLLAGAVVLVAGATGVAVPGTAHAERTDDEIPPRVAEVIETLRREADSLPREVQAMLPQVIDQLERHGEELIWPSDDGGHIPPPTGDGWTPPPELQGNPDGKYFDIETFVNNIKHVLDSTTVGYAVSIGMDGQLAVQFGRGDARTDADAPWLAQSALKPMTVASVSKPITAVLVMRLLDDHGIDIDESVEPWLPETWELGSDVGDLTFRALLTHESGLGQSFEDATEATTDDELLEVKSTGWYDDIRTAVKNLDEVPVPGTGGDYYANMNFSIFRLILPKLVWGHDFSEEIDDPTMDAWLYDMSYGISFENLLQDLYAPIGVSVDCSALGANPTILYDWPYTFDSGWEVPSYLQRCGGFGFHVSAHDLASFMSHLRYTEQLVSAETRKQMYEEELGLIRDTGPFGGYIGHDGRWRSTGVGGMLSCVMSFEIHLDASLLINSLDTATLAQPQACTVLKTAFENAWV